MTVTLRDQFLLDPEVVFLNHGSFGACPRPVFAAYQQWQRELERQPVRFLGRELGDFLAAVRGKLGDYLHVPAGELVLIPNATYGVNVVARSLALGPGDEVLTTDHEYGACDKTWEFICGKTGADYVHQPIPLPAVSAEAILEQFWAGVTPRTRLIYLSHITSPTALCLPVDAICQRARAAGILTLIDGAHAPGQVPLNLAALGADFYVGNIHKWVGSPKGAAFLHVRPESQHLIKPLVVSWGWEEGQKIGQTVSMPDAIEWSGTHDPAAYLAVPAALDFMNEYDWPSVQRRCHRLLSAAMARVCALTGLAPLYPDGGGLYHQMAAMVLPTIRDLPGFKDRLYDEFQVEVPCIKWNGLNLIRVSVQAYNTEHDIDVLLTALANLLPEVTAG